MNRFVGKGVAGQHSSARATDDARMHTEIAQIHTEKFVAHRVRGLILMRMEDVRSTVLLLASIAELWLIVR